VYSCTVTPFLVLNLFIYPPLIKIATLADGLPGLGLKAVAGYSSVCFVLVV